MLFFHHYSFFVAADIASMTVPSSISVISAVTFCRRSMRLRGSGSGPSSSARPPSLVSTSNSFRSCSRFASSSVRLLASSSLSCYKAGHTSKLQFVYLEMDLSGNFASQSYSEFGIQISSAFS